jgi:rod shape-determining protein MreC
MHKKTARKNGVFTLFKRSRKRKTIYSAALCLGVIVFFHTRTGDYFSERCRFFMNSVKVAFFRCGDNLQRSCLNLYYFISHDVDQTLIKLHNENIELCEKIEDLKKLQRENEELRELLSLKKSINFSAAAAQVVSFFSDDFTQSLILDIGKIDGITLNDVVKNSDGLVGKIIEVNDDWSRVLVITDINSYIPVKIGDQRVNALMAGGNSNRLLISAIREDIPLNEGDEVKTSGYGIREDIFVGKIVKNGKKFMVQSSVDFNSLKYVIVLKKE